MVKKVNANELLLCKLSGECLDVTAFKHNGKIIANRVHLTWEGGVQDISFGEVKHFADEKVVEAYVKEKIVSWLSDTTFPNIVAAIKVSVSVAPMQIGEFE